MFKKIVVLLILSIVLSTQAAFAAEAPYPTYNYVCCWDRIQMQSAYLPMGVIDGYDITAKGSDGQENRVPLSRPEDVAVDKADQIYVADTGNKRVVVFDKWGAYRRTVGEGVLDQPRGVYIDDEQTVYVADYGKKSVFLFDAAGQLKMTIGRPDSMLFGTDAPFKPMKVVADKRKNIYITSEGSIQGLIQLSPEGEFLGYFGGNKVGFDMTRFLQRMFYTNVQLDKLLKKTPPSANNIAIDDEGLVYTVTAGVWTEQIRKLNVAGNNLLPATSYTDRTWEDKIRSASNLADVTVDRMKNIYSVDATTGRIYEHDQDGNLLFIFGGTDTGNQRLGLFKSPSGIAVNSDGRLYVLDKERNNVQVLKPTEFANLVHKAIGLYLDGKYVQSEKPWQDVLRLNSMFELAHTGIGMAHFKNGNYQEALDQFVLSQNTREYSNAYWEIRRIWLMNHASTAMLVVVGVLVVVWLLRWAYRRFGLLRPVVNGWQSFKRNKVAARYFQMFRLLRHPIDGFYELEAERKGTIGSATVLLLLFFGVRLFELYQTSFLFSTVNKLDISLFSEIYKTFLPILGWVVVNYLVSTINDGEGKFRDIYKGTAYALTPYILFGIPLAVMSNGLTNMEAVVYDYSRLGMLLWCGLLFFLMIKEIHGYEIGETVKNIVLTLIGMLILSVIAFILFGLSNQVLDFVYSIYQEVKLRV